MVRHPLIALVVGLTCTHGVVAGIILGTIEAIAADEDRAIHFAVGFFYGMLVVAAVSSLLMLHFRRSIRQLWRDTGLS